MRNPSTPVADRFWPKVRKTDQCWEWIAGTDGHGYGHIGMGGHKGPTRKAHRVSWELHNGPIPDGLFVCHHCDNRACVRPDHLFLGTNSDNMRDCYQKGRARNVLLPGRAGAFGQDHPQARLRDDDVREIRRVLAGGARQIDVARRFGVCISTICQIHKRRHWGHVV